MSPAGSADSSSSHRCRYWYRACRSASERFALLGPRLLTLGHEVVTCPRTILKQIVPPLALRYDQTAAANLHYIDLMDARREGDRLGQPHGLAAIAGEYRGACHDLTSGISHWDIHT